MDCPRIPILATCVVGAIGGAIIHAIAARRKKSFATFLLLEAMTQGFLLAGALHLMFCIACPEQLVEIIDTKGQPVHLDAATFKYRYLARCRNLPRFDDARGDRHFGFEIDLG